MKRRKFRVGGVVITVKTNVSCSQTHYSMASTACMYQMMQMMSAHSAKGKVFIGSPFVFVFKGREPTRGSGSKGFDHGFKFACVTPHLVGAHLQKRFRNRAGRLADAV